MNNSNNNVDKALQDLSSPSAEELNNKLIGTQISKLQQDMEHLKQNQEDNRDYRKKLVDFAKKFTIGYFCFVAVTLIALGFFNWHYAHYDANAKPPVLYSSEIIIALLGTTTANVLGLIFIVMKYFFKDSNNT